MAPRRPFRFGAACFGAPSRAAWVALARKAEALGYATLLMPDHFQAQLAPLTALMAAADATSTLRVGSYVFANDFRHPALLAKEAATLDLLSEGRFELGIGAGWAEPDYTRSGIAFEPPRVRVGRLAETIQVVKGLFAETPATFSGAHYRVTDLDGFPKPIQRPHPPILVAGSGRRLLSIAAREADIVSLLFNTGESRYHLADGLTASTAQRVEWVRQAAGERFDRLEFNTLVFDLAITADRRQAADQLAAPWGITGEQVLDTVHLLVGSVEQISEQLQTWRERFGISYITVVGEQHIDAFAAVVARLAGT